MKKHFIRLKYFSYSSGNQVLLLFYIIGFAVGTTTHTIELIKGGFLPYTHVALWKNIYWTILTFLDFTAIILILTSLKPALLLSNLIIVTDVIINLSGCDFSEIGNFQYSYRLYFQIFFCLYVLLTTPIILRNMKL